MSTIVLVLLTVVLFGAAFLTRRRFGVLGLGLAGGVVLSEVWTTPLADFLYNNGLIITDVGAVAEASIFLIVTPSLLLLIGGPTYKTRTLALYGAAALALFGVVLCLGAVRDSFVVTGTWYQILTFIRTYQPTLAGIGVVLAVIDMFLARSPHSGRERH